MASESNENVWKKVRADLAGELQSSDAESLKVFVRRRPINKKETDQGSPICVSVDEDRHTITLKKTDDEKSKAEDFTFDRTFGDTNQKQVFEAVGFDLVSCVIQGFNTCIFAYGQTSAGKSHSMVGTKTDIGVIPRTCAGIFHCLDNLVNSSVGGKTVTGAVVEASYYEIYNEKIQDLLNPDGGNLKG